MVNIPIAFLLKRAYRFDGCYFFLRIVSVFVAYVALVFVSAGFLSFYVAPKHGTKNVLVYVTICSVVGSLTVMACKGLGIALKETLNGNSRLGNPVVWMLLIGGAGCIAVQMNYLNKALDIFNTSIVTPIYYVMFTTFTITASAILYKEWSKLDSKNALGSICGFLTIICGVFLLHAFRDIKFSLRDLYGSVAGSGVSSHSGASSNRNLEANGDLSMLMNDFEEEDELNDSDEALISKNRQEIIHTKF